MKFLRVVLLYSLFITFNSDARTYPFTTINVPGSYTLAANVVNDQITISANNVTLDLSGHTITGASYGIIIDSGLDNVTIKNGSIRSVSADGIIVNNGCSQITIQDLTIENALRGIFFENTKSSVISHCDFNLNTTGLELVACSNILIQDSAARANTHAGFCLLESTTCVLENCQALSTGDGNTNIAHTGIFGFVSSGGSNNVFERCIANSTQGLTVTGSDSIIAGFALRGSETFAKIIDSESANSSSSLQGATIPYGIYLENSASSLITITGSLGNQSGAYASSAVWTSDGKYIAVAGADVIESALTGSGITIYSYDASTDLLQNINTIEISETINECSWSPNDQFLAVATNIASGSNLLIYSFDSTNNETTLVASAGTDIARALSAQWSPDGQYIAAGGELFPDYQFRIYFFNSVNETLTQVAHDIATGQVQSVSWSPDGNYVAIGGDNIPTNVVRVYSFDRASHTLIQVAGALGASPDVRHVEWSPNGKYLAVAGTAALTVLSFDPDTNVLSNVASLGGLGTLFVASWSSDGRYIVSNLSNSLNIVFFDESAHTLHSVSSRSFSGSILSGNWSPDGSVIAVAGIQPDLQNHFLLFSGLNFPQKNIILGNTVYGNSGGNIPNGIGISGSSIKNMITENTSYNNPLNYAFAANVFNQLFGCAPSDLQNISIDNLSVIMTPPHKNLLAQQILYKVCNPVISLLDSIETAISNIFNGCGPTPITAATIIDTSGYYCLANEINGTIEIAASDVVLDLNNYIITDGLIVQGNLDRISIGNGVVQAGTSDEALSVGSGSTNIALNGVTLKNGIKGALFENVTKATITHCDFTQNTTGFELNNSHMISLKHCIASNNTHAGFSLISSSTNCFEDCKAFDSGEGNTDLNGTIFGFVSMDGHANVFERCIANATQGLTVTGSNSIIAGFALRGSETCTKIIQSEASNSVSSPNGTAVSYGILLEHTFDSIQTITSALGSGGAVNAVTWSSDVKYLAVGGGGLVNNNELQILQYRADNQSLQTIALALGTAGTINAIDWYPNNSYIAIGGDGLTSGLAHEVQICAFDEKFGTITPIIGIVDSTVSIEDVQWSPNGKYLAVVGLNSTGNSIQIFEFDPTKPSITFKVGAVPSATNITSVSWHPDNNFLAVTDGTGAGLGLRIYKFDPTFNTLTLVASDVILGVGVDVSWSPDGQYVAATFDAPSDILKLYTFNTNTAALTLVTSRSLDAGAVLDWSPDGRYLAIGGGGFASNNFQVFKFNPGVHTLQQVGGFLGLAGTVASIKWSGDGSAIAIGGDGLTGGAGEDLQIVTGLNFPEKNIIKDSVVYGNSGALLPEGIGISGSSIKNLIIENTSYNNPNNYQFVVNVFNQRYGDAPSDLQNIAVEGCAPICQVIDSILFAKQLRYKVCETIPSLFDEVQQSIVEVIEKFEKIDSIVDIIESFVDVMPGSCAPTPIFTAGTISTAGNYCLANDIDGTITIAASDVGLDLNNYKITDGLVINSSLNQISVENGVVEAASVQDAITINSGCSRINLDAVTVKNAVCGMNFVSLAGGSIENCEMTLNTTGLLLNSCQKVVVKNCIASCNTHAGFDLISSTTNCFEDCKALSTGEGNSDIAHVGIYGFVSQNGYGNIFERCIANSTQGLTVTGFDSMIAGFALDGSEHGTKIIDCEAANSTRNADGAARVYGIALKESLVDALTTTTGTLGTNGSALGVSWSPDGKYLAIVGNPSISGGSGQEVQIFGFDYANQAFTFAAGSTLNGTGAVVKWSPSGRYLAVGTLAGGFDSVLIYSFDPTVASLSVETTLNAVGQVVSLSWSPDNTLLAISTNMTNKVQVYQFDEALAMLTLLDEQVTESGTVNSVSWSPDGNFVVVGGLFIPTGASLRVYRFDTSIQSLILVASTLTAPQSILSAEWSQCGTYIAVCGTNLTNNNVQVFSFDTDSYALQYVAGTYGTSASYSSVSWSPNDSYLAVAGDGAARVQVALFDVGLNALFAQASGISTGSLNVITWSPDGTYVAIAGNGLSTNIVQAVQVLDFPKKNVIKNNTVYGNGSDCPGAIGISGSSIANLIIGNTSYNNPQNYAFVQNVFNQLFGQAPTDLQNISVIGCAPLAIPFDDVSAAKKILYNVCTLIPGKLQELNSIVYTVAIKERNNLSQLEVISSLLDTKLDTLFECAPTPVLNPGSISTSGFYCLANDINGALSIAASDVVLDLNNYKITNGLSIATNVNRVLVKEGVVEAGSAIHAISVGTGSSDVSFSHVLSRGGLTGINYSHVHGGIIEQCEMTLNTTGLQLDNSYKIVVRDSVASYNKHAGFSLLSSTTNCFEDCKALSTGEGNSDIAHVGIYGFVSQNGYGNIFERCIANSTQGLTVTGFDSMIAGFALDGSEHGTKIIDCEAANSTRNADGAARVYGIALKESLVDALTTTTGTLGTNGSALGVSWSPDGKYLAIVGNPSISGGSGQEVQIFGFDYANQAFTFAAGSTLNGTGAVVKWSPSGRYLAVGTLAGGFDSVLIYSFDPTVASLSVETTLNAVGQVVSLSWSPDNTLLAISTNMTNKVQVYQFDEALAMLTLLDEQVTESGTVNSVSWSPDGNFVVVGGLFIPTGASLRVYRFDTSIQSLILVASTLTAPQSILSAEWSQCGTYIAVCGTNLTNNNVQVFSFDTDSYALQYVAGTYGTSASYSSVSWSPNDSYLAVAGDGAARVQVALFDVGLNALFAQASGISTGSLNVITWSPDGTYVAIAGNGLSTNIVQAVQVLDFPKKNVIKNNTVYGNGSDCPGAIGISGSSIANLIIGNTSYNNPQNYAFVQNVFNQLFGQAPTDLQNISVKGCAAICQPEDPVLLSKQLLYKVCYGIPTQLDTIESIIDSKIISANSCASIALTSNDVIGGAITLATPGNYCLAEDVTADIIITTTCIRLDLNDRCLRGTFSVSTSDDVIIRNGYVDPFAPTSSPSAAITIGSTSVGTRLEYLYIRAADTVANGIAGRTGISINGPRTYVVNSTIVAGSGGNSTSGAGGAGGTGIVLSNQSHHSVIKQCTISGGNGGSTTSVASNGGSGGIGVRVTSGTNIQIYNSTIMRTGSGGNGGATSGVGGDGGNGFDVQSGASDVTIRNNRIKNTGSAGTGGGGSGVAGKAVDDNVTVTANLSMIYSNFAHNIANSIKFDLQATGVESGIFIPNPPTSTVINPLANVYAS